MRIAAFLPSLYTKIYTVGTSERIPVIRGTRREFVVIYSRFVRIYYIFVRFLSFAVLLLLIIVIIIFFVITLGIPKLRLVFRLNRLSHGSLSRNETFFSF